MKDKENFQENYISFSLVNYENPRIIWLEDGTNGKLDTIQGPFFCAKVSNDIHGIFSQERPSRSQADMGALPSHPAVQDPTLQRRILEAEHN